MVTDDTDGRVQTVMNRAEEMGERWTNNGLCARERCAMREYFGEDFRGYAASPTMEELASWAALFRNEDVEHAKRYVERAEDKDQLFKKVNGAIRDAGYTHPSGKLLFEPRETSIGPTIPYVLAHLEVVAGINISRALRRHRGDLIDDDSRWDGYRYNI